MPSMVASRRWATAAVAVATSALVSGCLALETSFEISDDGTADVGIVTTIDTAQLEQLGGLFGQDASEFEDLSGDELLGEFTDDDPCDELSSDLVGYDVTTREIDEDGLVGVGCTVTGVPIEELTDLGDDSTLVIAQDDDGTSFEFVLGGVDELTAVGGDDVTGGLGLDFEELFELRVVVSAPGSIESSNASSTSGSTATWLITPDADFVAAGTATMSAQWSASGGSSGSSVWVVIVIILAVLAVAAIAVLLIRRSQGDQRSDQGAGGAPATVGSPPPPPPPSAPSAIPPSGPVPPPPPPSSSSPPSSPPPSAPPSPPPTA